MRKSQAFLALERSEQAQRDALVKLVSECHGILVAFEHELREAISNTNFKVLQLRVDEAQDVLDRYAL